LPVGLRRGGVEDGDNLEIRVRRLHVSRRDERVLLEATTDTGALAASRF
jgi:hypothetical protein